MDILIKFVVILALYLPSIAWSGYVFGIAWAWFVTPVFGIALTFAQAVGLTAIIGYVTVHMPAEGAPVSSMAYTISMAILKPAIFLFCAWLVRIAFF